MSIQALRPELRGIEKVIVTCAIFALNVGHL